MKIRLVQITCIIAIMIPMAGCPASGSGIMLGVWAFSLNADTTDTFAELLPNGVVNINPPVSGGTFVGKMFWGQNGTRIVITRVTDFGVIAYEGTIASSTSIINGTSNSSPTTAGTWIAMKVP